MPQDASHLSEKFNVSLSDLEKKAKRLGALVDAVGNSVYRMSPDWHEMWEMKGAGFLTDTREPRRDWVNHYIFPEDRSHVLATIGEAIRGVAVFDLEHRVRRPDGSEAWAHSRAVPILAPGGEVEEWFGVASDITARRRAEEARGVLAAIVSSADDAIVSKDLNSIVTSWNPAAERLFGYNADEMIGQSIRKIIPPELQDEEGMILTKIRAGERIEHFETTRLRKDGTPIEVSVTISPVRDSSGRVIGASKIARDISEKRTIQRLLIQSEKLAATGRMAATVAHELNNPLEAITNLVYLAATACDGNETATLYLHNAEQELRRASHIVRKTLGYYRDVSNPVETGLAEILEEVIRAYETKLVNADIHIERSYKTEEPIITNPGELIQVISNLVANAIDAMPAGGRLFLGLLREKHGDFDGVRVTVKDTGHGINPEHLQRIFEPFFTTKGSVGNGIGLWISRQIVQKHGGQVIIESINTGDDTGTSVQLLLPRESLHLKGRASRSSS